LHWFFGAEFGEGLRAEFGARSHCDLFPGQKDGGGHNVESQERDEPEDLVEAARELVVAHRHELRELNDPEDKKDQDKKKEKVGHGSPAVRFW
jgi:hypothetical protein